ncbi:hypothetical protein FQN54_007664 [Arachnomyces sp. PD_36]|nr:hypothetical protein FQN54_007664 [Arachnomyces sp. PD_36]
MSSLIAVSDVQEEAYASPESPLTSILSTSTSSGRSRRTKGSLEDSSDDILLRAQAFRVGGPFLAPLGTDFELVPSTSELGQDWQNTLKGETNTILQRANISPRFFHLIYYPSGNAPSMAATLSFPQATIFIIAAAAGTEREWVPVAEAIRRLCIALHKPHINVELLDDRAYEKTHSYPIASSEPIVQVWDSVEPAAIALLKGKSWVSLSILRRGKPSGPKPPTAVLTVSKTSGDDWAVIRDDLIRLFDSHGLNYLGVEVIRGDSVFSNSHDRILLEEHDFTTKLAMGRSMGPRGSTENPSTFGGFVHIQLESGDWEVFGLTCFHCVAPADLNHPSLRTWQQEGIFPNDPTNNLETDSPSLGDAEETARAWQWRIDSYKDSTYRDVERRLATPNEAVPPVEIARYQRGKTLASVHEGDLQLYCDFFSEEKERLGKVFAGSGLPEVVGSGNNPRALDWALIKIDNKARISGNTLPELQDLPNNLIDAPYRDPGGSIQGVAAMQPDMDLFKMGRSTKFTVGKLNGVRKTTLNTWTLDASGTLVETPSHAYVAVPTTLYNGIFGSKGDAGSFVLDSNGRLVGLFLGGATDGTGYFTSAEDLITDIKRVTGAKDVSFKV